MQEKPLKDWKESDWLQPRKSCRLVLTKNNFNGKLCFHKTIDLTNKFTGVQLEYLKIILEKEGYSVNIEEDTYTGIYDPSRVKNLEVINRDWSNEELLNFQLQDLTRQLNSLKSKKWWWFIFNKY